MLKFQASNAEVDRSDYDMVEYLGELRESVLEAYTGIVQGLKGPDDEVSFNYNIVSTYIANNNIIITTLYFY